MSCPSASLQNSLRFQRNTSSKQCGSCYACCLCLGIQRLGKKAYQCCPNVVASTKSSCSGRCGIHPNHPEECKKYSCLWLQGAFDSMFPLDVIDSLRPDRCGVLFSSVMSLVSSNTSVLTCYEVYPGSTDSDPGKSLVDKLGALLPVMKWRQDQNTRKMQVSLVGDPNLIRSCSEEIEKMSEETNEQ